MAEATAIIKEEEFQLLDTNEEYKKFGKIQQVLTPVSISTNNSRENASTTPRTPCRFFAQGTCNKGNNCTFLHVTSSGQPTNAAGNAMPSIAPVQQRAASGNQGYQTKREAKSPPNGDCHKCKEQLGSAYGGH